jgi:hypothetical protein
MFRGLLIFFVCTIFFSLASCFVHIVNAWMHMYVLYKFLWPMNLYVLYTFSYSEGSDFQPDGPTLSLLETVFFNIRLRQLSALAPMNSDKIGGEGKFFLIHPHPSKPSPPLSPPCRRCLVLAAPSIRIHVRRTLYRSVTCDFFCVGYDSPFKLVSCDFFV